MEYTKHLSEPWFSLVLLKLKTVEGRLNNKVFKEMKPGDTIIFYNDDLGFKRTITILVESTKLYNSFEEYLRKETLKKALPGIKSIENGKKVYFKYFSESDEKKYKVKAIRLSIASLKTKKTSL